MAKPRFYQPGVIKPHPRVTHKSLNGRCDLYIGEGADLIAAGVLQEHMLPPRVSLSWRPAGMKKEADGSVMNLPGYLTVTRNPEGGYRVFLTVSREERAARQERDERRAREWRAKEQRSGAQPAATSPGATRRKDPEDFRAMALLSCQVLQNLITKGMEGLAVAPDDQESLLSATTELQGLLRSARVLDTTKRKHLVLAWSA